MPPIKRFKLAAFDAVKNVVCQCVIEQSKASANPNGNFVQDTKQMRIARAVRIPLGGRVVFGNSPSRSVNFLGRTEGQSGGSMGPLRNKH